MGVRRLAAGPSTLGSPTVGFIPCGCGSVSGPESPARAHRAARCRTLSRTSTRRAPGRGRWRSYRGVGTLRRRGGIGSRGVVARFGTRPATSDRAHRRAGAFHHRRARGQRRRRPSRRRLRPGVPAGARSGGGLRARLAGAAHPGRWGRRAVARRDCCAGAPSQRQRRAHAPSRRHRHAQRGGPVTTVRSPLDAWPGPPDGPAPRPSCRSTPLFHGQVKAPAPQSPVAEESTPRQCRRTAMSLLLSVSVHSPSLDHGQERAW